MSDINVLVVFYSRHGTTEKLALAAALGAIQARANIRLRRVVDDADQKTIDESPSWREHVARMARDYVAPRPADPVWADVIVLATPGVSSDEIVKYCSVLQSGQSMAGKIAAPLGSGENESVLESVHAAAASAGLTVASPPKGSADQLAAARAFGREVTQMARSLKRQIS